MIAATVLSLATIIFTYPATISGTITHRCHAQARWEAPQHPVATCVGGLCNVVGATRYTEWADQTCTLIGNFSPTPTNRDTNLQYYFFQLPNLDTTLPGLQVAACIAAVDANGTESACIDGHTLVPLDVNAPLDGGSYTPPLKVMEP